MSAWPRSSATGLNFGAVVAAPAIARTAIIIVIGKTSFIVCPQPRPMSQRAML
jgi:hypothetical protein